jgi:hypothetical protein
VRFVDGLKANKQKCKKSETEANYEKTGKIYDSAGQFIGYGDISKASDSPYSAWVVVPALKNSVDVFIKGQKKVDPTTGYTSFEPTDVSQGDIASYGTYAQFYFAQANCQGTQYLSAGQRGNVYRDPATDALMQYQGTLVPIIALSRKSQYWDWTKKQWVDDSYRYDPATNTYVACETYKTPNTYPSIYLPYAPAAVTNLPFTLPIKLPLVQK